MNHKLFAIVSLGWVATFASADECGVSPCNLRKEMRRGTPCSWDAQFRAGAIGCQPRGKTRGTVLYSVGACPRLQARMQGTVWKGKNFHCDDTFTNRWACFQAVSAAITVDASWLDGQPCFVMQYADDAPVFGGIRDELREIAPNVWLGRSYVAATSELKNYFLLEGICLPSCR